MSSEPSPGRTRRAGSPWTGLGAVFHHELADNLSSVRMRLLEVFVLVAGSWAAYSALGEIKTSIDQDPFVFLRIFTTVTREVPLSFLGFLGLLVPIVAIALGFDAINGEFNRRTMSRILAQPIYRDVLLFGKFLAGLATLAIFLTSLWLFMMGLGIVLIGLLPSGEEILRGLGFLIAAIAYGGIWLAVAILFSVVFRSPATAALASLALWLFFTVFWPMMAPAAARAMVTIDPYDPMTQVLQIQVEQGLTRFAPNTLFAETTLVLLNPATRALGPIFTYQLHGALIGAPLPLSQSFLLIWPQMTGLLAGLILLFTVAYVLFQRQEVRA